MVPWALRNRWLNCLLTIRSMLFVVSHIFREGNTCADSLANVGLNSHVNLLVWWNSVPDFLLDEYTRNRLGMPNFRFTVHWKGFGLVPLFLFVLFPFFWAIYFGF